MLEPTLMSLLENANISANTKLNKERKKTRYIIIVIDIYIHDTDTYTSSWNQYLGVFDGGELRLTHAFEESKAVMKMREMMTMMVDRS